MCPLRSAASVPSGKLCGLLVPGVSELFSAAVPHPCNHHCSEGPVPTGSDREHRVCLPLSLQVSEAPEKDQALKAPKGPLLQTPGGFSRFLRHSLSSPPSASVRCLYFSLLPFRWVWSHFILNCFIYIFYLQTNLGPVESRRRINLM